MVGVGRNGYSEGTKEKIKTENKNEAKEWNRGSQIGRYAMGDSEIGSGGQISERMTRCQVPTGVDVEIDVQWMRAVQHDAMQCLTRQDQRQACN